MTTRTSNPPTPPTEASIRALRDELHGTLIGPADDAYDDARALWNGMFDHHPALIARCRNADDVIAAVAFARETGLELAVRGGGHNVAGLAGVDDGLVIDLRDMNDVRVDPEARRARVGGGATLADLDRATQAFGLATPLGVVSKTGVAGLTLGGGFGWLRRRYGLSCDNLVGAELIAADGRVLRVGERENEELLWGLRGGGGNFGVVTELEYRLHPVGPEVAFAFVLYPLESAAAVLRAHDRFVADAPDAISTLLSLGRVPRAEDFPQRLHGAPFAGILGMHAGPTDAGEAALRPLREIAEPLLDLSGTTPYLELQQLLDEDYPDGGRYYWKSTNLGELTDDAIGTLVRCARSAPSDRTTLDLWPQGGAVARVGAGATAFGRRDVPYVVNPEANWEDPADDEANIAWVRGCLEELETHAAGGSYLNFPGFLEEGSAQVEAAFGENHRRLARLKAELDPDNLFRRNPNVAPAAPDRA